MRSATAGNIKRIIREKGFLQRSVAERAGYNPKTFNNMLNGRKVITDNDVKNIAIALDVELNRLFGIGCKKTVLQEGAPLMDGVKTEDIPKDKFGMPQFSNPMG